jgi:hypothetical protein
MKGINTTFSKIQIVPDMKKLPAFILIILISTAAMSAKDSFGIKNGINDRTASEKQSKKSKLLLSFGANLSSYLYQESEWQLGYSVGLTFNFRVYKNLLMTLPCSYTRINTAPKNVEGVSYSDYGEYIYKTLTNWQISIGFLEIPILFSYKILTAKRYKLNYILGPGLVIAVKDFSRIENVTITNEIIGFNDYGSDLGPYYYLRENSGLNISTGIRLHVSRFYIDLLYVLYPYKIKQINKLNSISLRLGIDMG